jgi:ornithine cyclodeaminase/alanine dehydrogenase-like protein (mu-crystallin family)
MPDAVAAVEAAFRQHGTGQAHNHPRIRLRRADTHFHLMAASVAEAGFGLKAYTVGPAGARFVALLWDDASGDLRAVIEADRLGQIRTGAATAVATQYLARPDATTVGLIGCGWQAESQLQAVCSVMPIRQAYVYCRTPERRATFAAHMAEQLGISVVVAAHPQEACQAHVVITATTSSRPVLDGRWLPDGVHINAVGSNRAHAQELDVHAVERADVIAIDDRVQGGMEAGDLLAAQRAGLLDWTRVVELGQIVAGSATGRRTAGDITLFESLGIALEDVAVARLVYQRAVETGRGERLPETVLG